MRFVCRMRSRSSVARSRETRRRSSSFGVGGTGRAQTRGSPRCQAISVRSSVSPSIASVLARRWRRGTAIDAGPTTWLSTPLGSSKRNPETIEPDFLDRYNLDRRCDALLGSALQPRKKVEQFVRVTADERVLGHLPAAERQ